jgi:hypothetical protein
LKTITFFAVAAILLMDLFGSKSSIGGPMADLLVSFVAMLCVGIYEAWGSGPVGWFVDCLLAVVGGVIALCLMSLALEATVSALHVQGRLATLNHPLRYMADVLMPIATVLGSCAVTRLVHRAARLLTYRTN